MKDEIERARSRQDRTGELAADARDARERRDLYEARDGGPSVSSFGQLRKLEQQADLAERRLRRAQGDESTPAEPLTHPEIQPEDPDKGDDFGTGAGV
jgi:hypothetical protein